MNYQKYRTVMTGGAMAAALLFAQIAPVSAQETRTITLDAGTVIPVKLRNTLSSVDSRKGDRFIATLQSDDSARSLDLPLGTSIEGTVTGVRAQEGKNPGVISLSFNRITLLVGVLLVLFLFVLLLLALSLLALRLLLLLLFGGKRRS